MSTDNVIASFKRLNPSTSAASTLAEHLAHLCAAKGISPRVLAQAPIPILQTLLTHLLGEITPLHHVADIHLALSSQAHKNIASTYEGSILENKEIDRGIYEASSHEPTTSLRSAIWRGAAGRYHRGTDSTLSKYQRICSLPIAVLGAGPAGILAVRALVNLGFHNIHWLDEHGQYGGIWRKPNLLGGRQALPFSLRFERHFLKAAPGDGQEIYDFLHSLINDATYPLPAIRRARATAIAPGDMDHKITLVDKHGHTGTLRVPIVINAIGVGDPLPPSRPGKVTTSVDPANAGLRWQEAWDETQARTLTHQHLVFIGLSNATLEMVRQIHTWQNRGFPMTYQIITHYPDASLHQPTERVQHKDNSFHFYRDVANYHLLRVAGDIPEVRNAFTRARDTGRILSHITHWERPNAHTILATDDQNHMHHVKCSRLYTLIGYGPSAGLLDTMGLHVNNPYLGAINMDFDGEAHRPNPEHLYGRARTWPGYFCLGIRNSFNPNEVLLPGLFFRLPNVIAGLLLRACEHTSTPAQ